MKNEEIDLAVAEALGKTVCHGCLNEIDEDVCHCGIAYANHVSWETSHSFVPIGCTCGYAEQTPDMRHGIPRYSEDLNAMHDAEDWLDGGCRCWYCEEGKGESSATTAYVWNLSEVVGSGIQDEGFILIGANARQRAEAFLRTVGKWKE